MLVGRRPHYRHFVAVLVVAQVVAAGPGVAPVGRFKDAVPGEIQGVIVVGRDQYRGIPIKAVFFLARRRLGFDRPALKGFGFEPMSVAALRLGVDHSRIHKVYLSIEAVAATDSVPLIVGWALDGQSAAWAGPASVVLKPAIDPVWFLVINADLVELAERNCVHILPALTPVIRKVYAAVGTGDHMVGISRIYP